MRLKETWDEKCDKCDGVAVCHTEDGCDLCVSHMDDVCVCVECKAPMGLATSVYISGDHSYCHPCYTKIAHQRMRKAAKRETRCECGNLFEGRMYIGERQVCKACFMKPAKKKKLNDAVGSTCDVCKEVEPKLRWTKNCDGVRWMCEKCIKKEKEESDLANASKRPLGVRLCACGTKLKGYQEDMCDDCFDENWDAKWNRIDDDLASIQASGFKINADPYEPTTLDQIIIVREYPSQKKGKFNDRKKAKADTKPLVVDTTPKNLEINKRLGFVEDSAVTKCDSAIPALKNREPVKADAIHGWFCFVDGKIEFRGKWASIPSINYDIEDRPSDVKIREYARIFMQDLEERRKVGSSNA